MDRHIDEVQRIRLAEQDGSMGARDARKARFQTALRKDKAYHPRYMEPLKVKGVVYAAVGIAMAAATFRFKIMQAT